MAKARYYLDTSVWGGVGDPAFEPDTTMLFNMIESKRIVCIYSKIMELELVRAPRRVREDFRDWPVELKEEVKITPEILKLANMYIEEGVVGKTSRDDCIHIAAATIHKADMLISWNFRHIVGIVRVVGYNNINKRVGYQELEIRSPHEALKYEI